MISGGDVALRWDSYLAEGGEKSRGGAVLGNATLAAQMGTTVSALLGGAVVTLSYGHLLWANAILSWIPVLLVLCITEPPASYERPKKWTQNLKEVLSATLVRDTATRLVFLNLVVWASGALVMFWVNQKYWQESAVPCLVRRPVVGAGFCSGFCSSSAGAWAGCCSSKHSARGSLPRSARP